MGRKSVTTTCSPLLCSCFLVSFRASLGLDSLRYTSLSIRCWPFIVFSLYITYPIPLDLSIT